MNFDYTTGLLREQLRRLQENVAEWENEIDRNAINKPRLEFVRKKIEELEKAIEILERGN
jgi:gas vesicle protein